MNSLALFTLFILAIYPIINCDEKGDDQAKIDEIKGEISKIDKTLEELQGMKGVVDVREHLEKFKGTLITLEKRIENEPESLKKVAKNKLIGLKKEIDNFIQSLNLKTKPTIPTTTEAPTTKSSESTSNVSGTTHSTTPSPTTPFDYKSLEGDIQSLIKKLEKYKNTINERDHLKKYIKRIDLYEGAINSESGKLKENAEKELTELIIEIKKYMKDIEDNLSGLF